MEKFNQLDKHQD